LRENELRNHHRAIILREVIVVSRFPEAVYG
jgi:hypothetical protein